MDKENWILCPVCGNKTRLKIRKDTELKNFPLFCPKCRQETLIHVKQFNITVAKQYACWLRVIGSASVRLAL